MYFSFEKESVDGEKKRKLLPVLNPETGKMEDRYAELIQQEMNDEDDESSDEEQNQNLEDELDKPLTEEDIRKIQQEMNQTWPKRLANVSSYRLYDIGSYAELEVVWGLSEHLGSESCNGTTRTSRSCSYKMFHASSFIRW